MKTQKDYVLSAINQLGAVATLGELYRTTDVSAWNTKTPFATIRRIVQTSDEIFKIQPGLYALSAKKGEILERLGLENGTKSECKSKIAEHKNATQKSDFTHAYFQGIIAQIGIFRHFESYIPPQDKNKAFLNKKLGETANLREIYDFAYPQILKFAKTIDVVWFNSRQMPYAFFEIEHSTDFKNSINKFYELQDFRARFFVVAHRARKVQFESVLKASIYAPIKNLVKFADYESIVAQYEKESLQVVAGI